MVLVGDGNGLVGYGLGKHHSTGRIALRAAQLSAIKNMDWVERFEKRTIWTETKYGATRLILRPRPVGFGLRCNLYLHQILRAGRRG
jgi:small subunit ribosomal protein S5